MCRKVKQDERDGIQDGKLGITSTTQYRCERELWTLTGDGISDGYKKELLEERKCSLFDTFTPGVGFDGRRAEADATESRLSLKIAKWALRIAGLSLIIAVFAIIQNCGN